MKKFAVGMLLALLLYFPGTARAYQPDQAYTYKDGKAVPSANVFQVVAVIDQQVMGCGSLKNAQDIFVDSRDQVYILDSGNMRVLALDAQYRCVHELKEFSYNGETLTLAEGAQGLFYREATEELYIADTKNNRVLVSDLAGNVSRVYEKPVSSLLDANVSYSPRKIVVDNMGLMYVTSGNVNTGALLIDGENTFLGFYGINAIKETFAVMVEYMWRSILTDEQNAQSAYSFQPTEFNNLFWSSDRFVYAVSPYSATIQSPVVKLNAVGNNVFPSGAAFGDMALSRSDEQLAQDMPIFADITVDGDGLFTILDMHNGRLFQYDAECNLLAVFGGLGAQQGLFTSPVSIAADSRNRILVLDAGKNTVTVMERTFYGEKIKEAVFLHNDGRYEEALAPWAEIIKMNANYNLAYVGMGKAYMKLGQYEQAKRYFRLAGDQENYAAAKEALRGVRLRENFASIATGVIILLLLILFSDYLRRLSRRIFHGVAKRRRKQ